MKLYSIIFLFIIILFAPTNFSAKDDRPKIGLVLSGGGARGLAHIGTLKLIDSLQIPIDYIVGTSMGGVIGALYASGYTGNEIEKYALTTDWNELLEDKPPRSELPFLIKRNDGKFQLELGIEGFTPVIPSGFIHGQMISLRFSDLTSAVGSIRDFDNLPIPFRCIAIDLITGTEVVLKGGSLSKAMRSTMSIPTIFSPVEWGDSLLIDGGVLNNFPADVLKEMGADIIIGVNVGSQLLPRNELNSLLDVFAQTMVLTDFPKQKENYKLCNVIIQPELEGFTATGFEKESVLEIVKRGIDAASLNKSKLVEFKNKYVYDPFQIIDNGIVTSTEPVISSIVLSGKSSYTLEYLYELIDHSPSDVLDLIKLQDRISEMKNSNLFDEVEYSIQLIGAEQVILHFKLIEKKQPLIYGFTIIGNEKLHFDFILDILGLRPGDPFDKEKLNKQITYMASLGYFEEITYIIEHVRDNYLRVILTVKEKPLRKLQIGFRYDDRYKIVGILGLQAANTPFLGMREELLIQFAGLFKVDYIAFYPSRTLNFPLYPYIRIAYKNIPVDIFDFSSGEKMAEYNDDSWILGFGFGHILRNTGVIRIEYNHEYLNIAPNLGGLNPEEYSSWEHELHILQGDIKLDRLDDPITPRSGYLFDFSYNLSLKKLGSALEYRNFLVDGKFFISPFQRHTFSLAGFYTKAYHIDFPIYKYPIKGGVDTFVGMKINQIEGYNYGYIRFDYRLQFGNSLFFKLIGNVGKFYYDHPLLPNKFITNLYGFGFGLKYSTIIGPFQLIFSRGSKSVFDSNDFQNVVYFTAGYIF